MLEAIRVIIVFSFIALSWIVEEQVARIVCIGVAALLMFVEVCTQEIIKAIRRGR